MVQLELFTTSTSDNLSKNNFYDNNYLQNRKENFKILFNSYELRKSIISKFSGRLLIGQNYSLDVLQLDDIFLQFKKRRNDQNHTFRC